MNTNTNTSGGKTPPHIALGYDPNFSSFNFKEARMLYPVLTKQNEMLLTLIKNTRNAVLESKKSYVHHYSTDGFDIVETVQNVVKDLTFRGFSVDVKRSKLAITLTISGWHHGS